MGGLDNRRIVEPERARLPVRLVEVSIRNPRLIVCAWLSIVLLVSPGLFYLEVDTSTDSVLDRSSTEWSFYELSQEMFGGDEIVVVALRTDVPFSTDSLIAHDKFARQFELISGIARVDSLATLPIVEVEQGGELRLDPALAGISDSPLGAARRLRKISRFDRIIPDTLISRDGRTTALSLILEPGMEEQQERILSEIDVIVAGSGALVSGVPVFRVEANKRTRTEILRFAQATALILALYLLWMFRSVQAVIYGLIPGSLGTIVVISILGILGTPISIATMILPSMLIALGCAYSMHVLVACSGHGRSDNIMTSVRNLALPISLSGLTTAVGLISLSLIRIDTVSDVGLYGSVGVLVITAMSLSFLPALIVLRPLNSERIGSSWGFESLVSFIEKYRAGILGAWFILACLCAFGLTKIEVETDATTWFRDGHPVREAYLEIREQLSGISPMNIVVTMNDSGSVLEPDVLARIDEFSNFLQAQPEVGKAISVADPLRQIHGGFSGNPEFPLPDSRALAEQYMILLESVELIGDVITADRQSANLILRIDDNGSGDLLALAERAENWWGVHGAVGTSARATGIMYEFARAEDAIAYGQIAGLSFALAAISLILMLILRRVRLAIISLVPNTIPLVMIFGFMGLAEIPIDAGTVLIGGLALGVAVDDTIHLMTLFGTGIDAGLSSRESLLLSFKGVLPAIVASTVMISVGFGVFVFSDFGLTRNLGWLTSSVMIVCLLADVLLLGALVISFDWKKRGVTREAEADF